MYGAMMAMGSEFIGPHFEDAETSTSNPQNFVGLLVLHLSPKSSSGSKTW